MPTQDFRARPNVRRRMSSLVERVWRAGVFLPAIAVTAALVWGLSTVFATDGIGSFEYALLTLIGVTFVWVSLAVSTVVIGLISRTAPTTPVQPPKPLDVAVLVPIYNENVSDVFGNAAAMLQDLSRQHSPHRYALYILSDTRDAEIAAAEQVAYLHLSQQAPNGFAVHYRRRSDNRGKKVGNLADWITGWGAGHDAMLVLDADSLMSGATITHMADALSADPDAGLIQSYPQLIGARSLYGRLQQFSNVAYGWLLAEGLATWTRTEGNYWGHNAIIRTRAFAESAGLPQLSGARLILSHDFVEASLLRRAGWTVRFLPRLSGSFEETPGTLIDYIIRDQRWCRGNLQHLRLLGAKGLHPVSRFHLFQGAAAYLMSPAWFVLLVFWALLGRDAETNVIRYFNEANPLFPNWPPEMTHINSAVFLVIMYSILMAPKLTAATVIACYPKAARLYGGRLAFVRAFLVEVALSIAYAPILMVQQSRAVLRGLFRRDNGWAPQARDAQQHSLRTLLAFHWVETGLGGLLVLGMASGLVSLWLLPIAVSLLCAVPLSALSAVSMTRLSRAFQMNSPLTLREPAIVLNARRARAEMSGALAEDPALG